jgi:regulator of sigma E protease
MYIIIFIIILATLVFVHELGHFLVAKAAGIRVDEFALGFPPRIASFTRGGTRYALNLIPFGGYVKIFGEDNEPSEHGALPEIIDPQSFVAKPKYIQALVLLAGIAFNIIFAWLLLSVSFMTGMPAPSDYQGQGSVQNTALTITSVVNNSPAASAHLQTGDRIITLTAPDQTIQNPSGDAIQNFTAHHANQQIAITYIRGNHTNIANLTPTVRSGDTATIGISMETIGTLRFGFFPAFLQGAKLTGTLISATVVGLAQFVKTLFTGHAKVTDVSGPVGIAGLVNDATHLGFSYVLSFTALISINLAIINLIPFPALDGGRVLFVIIEKIRGKSLNQKFVRVVNTTGLALLLLLMLVVTYHDIAKLFVK